MKSFQLPVPAITTGLLALSIVGFPPLASATSSSTQGTPSGVAQESYPMKELVKKYMVSCLRKPTQAVDCEKVRASAVAILKEDLLTLGSTADRVYLPHIVRMFKSEEIELRIATADSIGMIGPQDSDVEMLAILTNDPVPDVRQAVSNMLSHGKGNAIDLLKQRTMPVRTGRAPEKPADASKLGLPVAPDSVYLFDSSDATKGRLSYVTRGNTDPARFFRAKAQKGPFTWEQFKEQYRFQLKDEDEALDQLQQAAGKHLENEKAPDPTTNMEAFMAHMQKLQSVSMQGSTGRIFFDTYQPNLYGAPTVYVLEERRIGQRNYPTRYVVVYQELAFKWPGYRLAWTTVPDAAIKTAQVTSLDEEKEELANKAEREAMKNKQAELDALTKKKDAAEKKQFKKGQDDLEKELGF